MKQYKFINNIAGLAVFVVAALVYIITSEPTASYWDCSEYISTAYKLQVGHPPGAPFFQLMGRFFSLFAFGNVHLVARMVNTMSALASGASSTSSWAMAGEPRVSATCSSNAMP